MWSSVLTDRVVPLAAAAQARVGLPVTIDNDANLVTLAELWFGAGRARACAQVPPQTRRTTRSAFAG